jgi:diguanylate cyclase (GGDEF)-like protein
MVLRRFAEIASSSLRPTDTLYRMGGEEFCFILPDTTVAGAIAAAERIRRTLELTRMLVEGEEVRVTASIGIATTDFAGFDLEVLLAAADAALYEAKARGRNRVVVADPTAIPRPKDGPAAFVDRRTG